jgi:hypothetical protein
MPLAIRKAMPPPINGPTTGTQEYAQSEEPFPGIGQKACAILGPKSRAGFKAYPVVPPKLAPKPQTNTATIQGPNPGAIPPTCLENIAKMLKTNITVAKISYSHATILHTSNKSTNGIDYNSKKWYY